MRSSSAPARTSECSPRRTRIEIYDNDDRNSFLAAVFEYAAQFTTPNKASKAVGLIKRAVQTGSELPFELALTLERELQA